MKKALITGVTRQDGAYLAELLMNKCFDDAGRSEGCRARRIGQEARLFYL
jgi:GDP-D-mannose dehydratase